MAGGPLNVLLTGEPNSLELSDAPCELEDSARPNLTPVPTAAALSAAGLAGVAGFQVALAAGAPGGRLAWGGAGGSGVLPTRLRVASAASAGLWIGAAALVLRGNQRATRCIAGLLVVGSAMNVASPSRAEARLWAPTTLALAGLTAAAGR